MLPLNWLAAAEEGEEEAKLAVSSLYTPSSYSAPLSSEAEPGTVYELREEATM